MKKFFYLFFILFLFVPGWGSAQQEAKQGIASRTDVSIKIDGVLDESAWEKAQVLTDFTESNPNPNTPSPYKTEVKILYDNVNVYVAGIMHDVSKDSILRQLCLRDEGTNRFRGDPFGQTNTDWFAVGFDSYRSGVDALIFSVSAAGVQYDVKFSSTGADKNWDAVWRSDVQLSDDRWVVEMAIPYSALRFPNAEEQDWNINFKRMVRRDRAHSWWNKIDPNIDGTINQFGNLKGINSVQAPVRLQATPFVAANFEVLSDPSASPRVSSGSNFSAGMDIKYGLTDAFTLDVSLIPDFGEVQSDNQVLNLSPFEVRFDENRPFFTEGTELFNKGGLFYSRRIGGLPVGFSSAYDELEDDEEIISNPIETPLINALKLSGRTGSGLGIGVFNAIVGKTFATVENSSGGIREIETNPLTNYNVLVFDQNLKNNSSVSLTNANTFRFGDTYDANSTAVTVNANNKKRTFNFNGNYRQSLRFGVEDDGGDEFGYSYRLSMSKTGGKLNYGATYIVESETFNPNDLGFLFNPNEQTSFAWANFTQFEPFGAFNRAGGGIEISYRRLFKPNLFDQFRVNLDNFWITKKFFAFGGWLEIQPVDQHDYFEPRVFDFETRLNQPAYAMFGTWVSSDYRKPFAYDIRFRYGKANRYNLSALGWEFSPRFRVNDRLSFVWETESIREFNQAGFATFDDNGNSVMGLRDVNTLINTLNGGLIFNAQMGVNARLRHYWSKVNYNSYNFLDDEGYLIPSDYDGNQDFVYNALNLDLVYRWRFAPGSDIIFTYKYSVLFGNDERTDVNYFQNFSLFNEAPQGNTFSLKVIYFLDYYVLKQGVKNRKSRKG